MRPYCTCRAQYLLWGVIAALGLLTMLAGCGAKGDLYLPEKTQQQQQR